MQNCGGKVLRISLDGDDWKVSGWMRHQWHFQKLMETDSFSLPGVLSVPAKVPGAVQADLLRAGILEDWNHGENFLHMEWVEHREWVYEKRFTVQSLDADRYDLCFDGLDYAGFVFLNGTQILAFEGMHLPHCADATKALREGDNLLRVVFTQVPEVDGQVGYTSRETTLKSRYNYGWDWMPRMVNIGIFGSVALRVRYGAAFNDVYPKTEMTESGDGNVKIQLSVDKITEEDYSVAAVVTDATGKTVASGAAPLSDAENGKLVLTVQKPALWNPNGFGEQPLYTVTVTLKKQDGETADREAFFVGFCTLSYVRPQGALASALPYTPVINGRRIPLRGLDWVPLSPFYGTVTETQYRNVLDKVKNLHINLLRVWGGALLESETFYRICDEYGIMVWQEFPQSSSGIDNSVCEDGDFVRRLCEVAKADVLRRRSHVSLTYWCGGNELYTPQYVPQGTETQNLAALSKVVETYNPEKLFLPASPSGPFAGFNDSQVGTGNLQDTHGPWNWGGINWHYTLFNRDDSLLHSEVGAPAASRMELLHLYRDKAPLWPPRKENRFWLTRGAWWLHYDQLSDWFGDFEAGPAENREERYVKAFRFTQLEALRYAAGAVRYAGEKKAGLIIWMGDEPFPNAANTSVLEFDGCPKPSFYALRDAFAPVMLGLRYPSLTAQNGQLKLEPFIRSDVQTKVENIQLTVYNAAGEQLACYPLAIESGGALPAETIDVKDTVLVSLTAEKPALTQRYVFCKDETHPLGALQNGSQTTLAARRVQGEIVVENTGSAVAWYPDVVAFDAKNQPLVAKRSPHSLLPGESVNLGFAGAVRVTVNALNCEETQTQF